MRNHQTKFENLFSSKISTWKPALGQQRRTTNRLQTMFILVMIKFFFQFFKSHFRSSHLKDLLRSHFSQILIHLQAVYMILSIVQSEQFKQQDERFMCVNNRFKYTFLSTIRWFIANPTSIFRKEWIFKRNWIIFLFLSRPHFADSRAWNVRELDPPN